MTPEVKEYISVNEKDFWKKESLQLTNLWKNLDSNIRTKVLDKITKINAKLDDNYDVSVLDNWKYDISETQKPKLIEQLKEVIKQFNVEINRIVNDYWNTSSLYLNEISSELSTFFDWKNLSFHNNASITEAIISAKNWLWNNNWEIVNNSLI